MKRVVDTLEVLLTEKYLEQERSSSGLLVSVIPEPTGAYDLVIRDRTFTAPRSQCSNIETRESCSWKHQKRRKRNSLDRAHNTRIQIVEREQRP